MKRREFITLLVGTAGWPLTAFAQQFRAPVVGWLHSASAGFTVHLVAAFRKGLSEAGFAERQNLSIEYRHANGQYEQLSGMAGELARRRVDVIFAGSPPAALAAGRVGSFNQPGGSATGITMVTGPLAQKRLEIARELLPKAASIVMIVNP